MIVGVLACAFASSFIMRSYPIKYGYYLNEFDPYFNYRATQFIVDNGIDAYWNWHDKMSWYPEGRNVAASSQSFLHISTAYLYMPFKGIVSLQDFTIILPVIWGSLTSLVIFAIVRVLWSTPAGLFASLLTAFSPPLILRGNLGWFKSEPFGLLLGLTALFMLLLSLRHKSVEPKAILFAVASGVTLALANASWGGSQFFSIPIAIFFIALPFIRKNDSATLYVLAIIFTASALLMTLAFERPGVAFVFGLPGIALMAATVFLINAHFIKKVLPHQSPVKGTLIILLIFVSAVIGLIGSGAYHVPDFRYLNAVNPFTTPKLSITQAVQEHGVPNLVDFFLSYSVLLMLAGLGIILAFRRRNDLSIFVLILGLTTLYVSGAMLRLLVFSSISIILLSSIALSRLISEYKYPNINNAELDTQNARRSRRFFISSVPYLKAGLVILLLFPLAIIPGLNWIEQADVMPIIVAGAGDGPRTDWIDATYWISRNTEEDAVIVAWWDYGYWITTLGNRTTIADNAAFYPYRIAKIGQMFISEPEQGIRVAQELQADYILVHISAQRIKPMDHAGNDLYVLGFSGDESKIYWFVTNGGFEPEIYLEGDNFTPKREFWNSTFIGTLIPFEHEGYVTLENGYVSPLMEEYQNNAFAVYSKKDPSENVGGLDFKYASTSLEESDEQISGVLLYKLEK